MLFNSLSFLAFFPLVVLVYFLLPRRTRWVWLLAASYYFYMCWNARYVLLIATSTVVTYACALGMERVQGRGGRRLVMLAGLCVNLGILGFFKYSGFFINLLGRGFGALGVTLSLPQVDVLLPVGISFYTFQALGYMLDVYRGEIRAERNLFRYALFVSFFPQLVAGPIERSKNLLHQVHEAHDFDAQRALSGLSVMLLGFFEKLVIADRASLYVSAVYGQWQQASGWQIALATAAFAFQIYGDFSGYSHIAIGAARVLGYDLMDNFRQPYFATSVRDFWRRWHISLSTWFRDYLYIPLGGSRVSPLRRALNVMITFTVSGLWHGASLNYVVWGMLNGAMQVIEGFLPKPKPGAVRRLARILVTFVLIDLTFLFFRASSLGTALRMLRRIAFSFGGAGIATDFSVWQAGVLGVALVILLALDALHECGHTLSGALSAVPGWARGALALLAVLLIVVFGIWGPGYDAQAFIYFQF